MEGKGIFWCNQKQFDEIMKAKRKLRNRARQAKRAYLRIQTKGRKKTAKIEARETLEACVEAYTRGRMTCMFPPSVRLQAIKHIQAHIDMYENEPFLLPEGFTTMGLYHHLRRGGPCPKMRT